MRRGDAGERGAQAANFDAEFESNAQPFRSFGIAAQDLHGANESVGGAVRRAEDVFIADGRIDVARLGAGDHARLFQPAAVLQGLSVAQQAQRIFAAGQKQIAQRLIAGVDADLVLESPELLARHHRQQDVRLRAELAAKAACSAWRAAEAEVRSTIDDQHVADSARREMVRDAGADHAGADDDDFGHTRSVSCA